MRLRRVATIGGTILVFFICFMTYLNTNSYYFPHQTRIHGNSMESHRSKRFQNIVNVSKVQSAFKMIYDNSCSFQVISVPETNIQLLELYKKLKFNSLYSGPGNTNLHDKWSENRKLKVYIVPHSHNDPGWIKTFEGYYHSKTKHILNNMIVKLSENHKRKFIWAEISFFALWWNDLPINDRETVKRLIRNNQLEFVTGGWVMNDEASSHWISIVHQMSEGHQWLKLHLNYTPTNHWAIDPFGLSSTQAVLLKQMGLQNMVVQRIHYAIRKHFEKTKNLQFLWKQSWDDMGNTGIFTEVMPFSGYGVRQSCGPSPTVCGEFDFRKLAQPNWPWNWIWDWNVKMPDAISNENVGDKAEVLLKQLRRKSTLYKTDILLVPLGNDFTFVTALEYDVQFQNYEKLIDYMNSKPDMFVQIQFGTLTDYFNAVHSEWNVSTFPTLTGDFFTYADQGHHYWSGYYTSRPFYKRMDRELLSYFRSAEIIFALTYLNNKSSPTKLTLSEEMHLRRLLTNARRTLALFQHHDAITGTSKRYVVNDYGNMLLEAIKNSQTIIQYCTNLLLSLPWTDADIIDTVVYNIDDIRQSSDSLAKKYTITIAHGDRKKIVLYNSLPYSRHEVVTFIVSSPFVAVQNFKDETVQCQVSPIFEYETTISNKKYLVSFIAEVPALGLIVYTIIGLSEHQTSLKTIHASIKIFHHEADAVPPQGFPNFKVFSNLNKFSIENNHINVSFNSFGLMEAVAIKVDKGKSATIRANLDFVQYGTKETDDKSGAYLFLPGGQATPLVTEYRPVKVVEGPLLSAVLVNLPYVQHTVTLYNSSGVDGLGIEIQNIVDISGTSNFEIAMRLSTDIESQDNFYTDLNGYQIIRRKRFNKLPLQGNYYPISTMAFIEDERSRLTLVTSTPLGCTSLQEGQIEIMLDRRINQDDRLGLGEGITDNHPTKHTFNVIVEKRLSTCKSMASDHPAGFPSLSAHVTSQSILNPLIRMLKNKENDLDMFDIYSPVSKEFGVDFTLASLKMDVIIERQYSMGLVLHRQYVDVCFISKQDLFGQFSLSHGSVNVSALLPKIKENVGFSKASLSFLHINDPIDFYSNISLCPMELQAFILHT